MKNLVTDSDAARMYVDDPKGIFQHAGLPPFKMGACTCDPIEMHHSPTGVALPNLVALVKPYGL